MALFGTVICEKPDILYSRQWPKMPAAAIGRILGIKTVSVEGNNLEHTLPPAKRPLLFHARRFCASVSTQVVANSQSLAREVKEVFRLNSKVTVIYNGIDIEYIRKKAEEEQKHRWFEN